MEISDILVLGGLGIMAYSLFSEQSQPMATFGSSGSSAVPNVSAGISSTGQPIEAKKKNEVPQVVYNINLEAPKLPEQPQPQGSQYTTKKQEVQPTKKTHASGVVEPKPVSKVIETKDKKYYVSEQYDKNIVEVAGVEDKQRQMSQDFGAVRPVIDVSTGTITGYHDYIRQQSVLPFDYEPKTKKEETINNILKPLESPITSMVFSSIFGGF